MLSSDSNEVDTLQKSQNHTPAKTCHDCAMCTCLYAMTFGFTVIWEAKST